MIIIFKRPQIDKSIVLKYNGNQSAPILSFSVRPKSQLASAESTNDLVFNFNGATNPILSLAFDCSLMGQFIPALIHFVCVCITDYFSVHISTSTIDPNCTNHQ